MNSDKPDDFASRASGDSSIVAWNFLHSSKSMRVPALLAILLVQGMAFLWLLPNDPLLVNRIRQQLHASPSPPTRDYAALSKGDPSIGSELPHDKTGDAIRRIAPKSQVAYLLVPIGDCASCLKANLPLWQSEAAKRRIPMILFSSASEADMKSFKGQMGLSSPIVKDAEGKMANFLNAAWLGRPYLFSADWHLIWASHEENALYNPFEHQDFQKAITGGSR